MHRIGLGLAAAAVPLALARVMEATGPVGSLTAALVVAILVVLARGRRDAVTVLTIFVLVLLFVPSRLVIGAVGATGTPANAVALFAAWLWGCGLILPGTWRAPGPQPVRTAALVFAAAHLASYVVAAARPMDALEATAADRGMTTIACSIGLTLFAADAIRNRQRLHFLIRVIVGAGAGVALIGILQFTLGIDLAASVRLPGLVYQSSEAGFISERSMFRRVAGTTEHAIEFSVVLATVLPLALWAAHHASERTRRRWWMAVVLIAVALPMSVSRTAVIAVLAAFVVLLPTWSRRRRRRLLAGVAVYLVAMRLLVPGLLGTIRAFFLSANQDPSIGARKLDYGYVVGFISERPVFGRGFTTFIPTRYDFLDNQFLLSLVETGIVGLLSLLALIVVAMSVARGARRRSTDPVTRELAQSLAAAIVVGAVTCATFDFLSFPTGRGLFFLLIGCAGASWRIERGAEQTPTTAPDRLDIPALRPHAAQAVPS